MSRGDLRWAIAEDLLADRTLLGVPERLEGGGEFSSAEEVFGAAWTEGLLRLILPSARTWLWCTSIAALRSSGICAGQWSGSPVALPTHRVDSRRSSWWTGAADLLIAPGSDATQANVLRFAGADSDRREVLASAPSAELWDVDSIARWLRDRDRWRTRASLNSLAFDRLVMLFGGYLHVAIPSAESTAFRESLARYASSRSVRITPGDRLDAWLHDQR